MKFKIFQSSILLSLIVLWACADKSPNSPQELAVSSSLNSEIPISSSTQISSITSSSQSSSSSAEWSDSIVVDFSEHSSVPNDVFGISTWATANRSHSTENVWIEDGILNLKVNGGTTPGETTTGAEIYTRKTDFLYGSYRFLAKSSAEPGTVVGFFYYKDDQNEIDIEFLSKDPYIVYYTIHENIGPNTHQTHSVTEPLSDAFHEYRFDWSPEKVDYYIDGQYITSLDSEIPNQPGTILLNHWTLSSPAWGGGPPVNDAIAQVKKVSFYFNP